MKTIIALTKIQMGSVLDFLNVFGKNKKNKKKKTGTFAIMVGSFVFFLMVSALYSLSMAMFFNETNQLHLLNGMMMAMACMITLVTTIYKASGTLFGQKDYDTLMSLPVKTSYIIASRVIILYILNFFFVLVIMLPAMVIYGIMASSSVMYYVYSIIGIIAMPIVPMILGSIVGVLFGVVSARFKRSNIINIIFTIVLFVGIMVFYFFMGRGDMMIEMGSVMTSMMTRIYPLAQMYIDGVVFGEIISLVLFVLISFAAFALFAVIIGKLFVKMNSFMSAVKKNKNFKMKEQKVRSQTGALIYKEMKRLFSSVIYLMNSTVGVLMLLIGLVAICVVPTEELALVAVVMGGADVLVYIVIVAISICISMVTTSACSTSLEGKSLWVIKSLPVSANTFFNAKIYFNMLISAPFIIAAAIISIILFKPGILQIFLLLYVPFSFSFFTSVLGARLNIRYPLLDWTNEAVVVKQSTATMITLFAGMFLSIIAGVLVFIPVFNPALVLFITATVLTLWALLLWNGLKKKAERVLYNL